MAETRCANVYNDSDPCTALAELDSTIAAQRETIAELVDVIRDYLNEIGRTETPLTPEMRAVYTAAQNVYWKARLP